LTQHNGKVEAVIYLRGVRLYYMVFVVIRTTVYKYINMAINYYSNLFHYYKSECFVNLIVHTEYKI